MKSYLFYIFLFMTSAVRSQETIPLYADSIPNSKPVPDIERSDTAQNGIVRIGKVSRPTLTVYLPPKEKATGAAVIICPGGGYFILAASHEGHDVAKKFNEMGVAAFVLKYRIPDDLTMVNKEIGPLQDAQRAIKVVRERSTEWNIKPDKIGIMGFSAGGHLASTAGTHFTKAHIPNPNNTSLRPDFMILVYPVVSFSDSVGHMGSRTQLLGKTPTKEKISEYSNELRVTSNTPPAFMVHAKDDHVRIENSFQFANALTKNKIENKVHVYEKGGHGYGMNNPTSNIKWMDLVFEWMKANRWVNGK